MDRSWQFPAGSANGRNRRILAVAARSGDGPFTIRFADLHHRAMQNRWFGELAIHALASRLRASWMEARATKAPRVAARFSKSSEQLLPHRHQQQRQFHGDDREKMISARRGGAFHAETGTQRMACPDPAQSIPPVAHLAAGADSSGRRSMRRQHRSRRQHPRSLQKRFCDFVMTDAPDVQDTKDVHFIMGDGGS